MLTGHCECGQVTFEVDGEIKDFSHCHCSQCRRLHGAAFASFAGIRRDEFRFLTGENVLSTYNSSPSNRRIFCSVCGSNILAALDAEPESLYLSMSALDGDPPRPAAYHIFVGSKAPWYEILDDLEKFDAETPEQA